MKTILFDFDGTIADTQETIINIIRLFEKDIKVKLTDELVREFRSMKMMDIIKQYHVPLWKIPFLLLKGKELLYGKMDSVVLCKGMGKLIEELHRKGYTVGIVSTNSTKNIERFLERHKLRTYFNMIYSASNIFGKHWVFQSIIKKHHLNKKGVLYVGDEVRDIEACKKVGIQCIAVGWGWNDKEFLKKFKPLKVVDTSNELIETIQSC